MPKESTRSTSSSPMAPAGPAPDMPQTYEAAMEELEHLVQRLESGDMPLDGLLSGYQRGSTLLQYCREKLQSIEDQIKVLDDGAVKVWKPQ